ncbi:hypothetical protein D3C87_1732910 [compost metagenome]
MMARTTSGLCPLAAVAADNEVSATAGTNPKPRTVRPNRIGATMIAARARKGAICGRKTSMSFRALIPITTPITVMTIDRIRGK